MILTTQFGDAQARTRRILHGEHPRRCPRGEQFLVIPNLGCLVRCGAPMRPCLLARTHGEVVGLRQPEGVVLNSAMRTTSNPLLPRACGTVGRERTPVYRVDGPAPTVLPTRPVWINASTGVGHVRCLVGRELWRLAGGRDADYGSLPDGVGLTLSGRALPPRAAEAVVRRAARRLTEAHKGCESRRRAGRCHHPEEDVVARRSETWFNAWE